MKRSNPPSLPEVVIVIREAAADKISARGDGRIHYLVGYLPDKSDVLLKIVSNDSSGLFSREWLSFNKIQSILADLPAESSFFPKALKDAFAGRSANNHSFLGAILLAEKLLERDVEKANQVKRAAGLEDWLKAVLSAKGKMIKPAEDARQAKLKQDAAGDKKDADHS